MPTHLGSALAKRHAQLTRDAEEAAVFEHLNPTAAQSTVNAAAINALIARIEQDTEYVTYLNEEAWAKETARLAAVQEQTTIEALRSEVASLKFEIDYLKSNQVEPTEDTTEDTTDYKTEDRGIPQ